MTQCLIWSDGMGFVLSFSNKVSFKTSIKNLKSDNNGKIKSFPAPDL